VNSRKSVVILWGLRILLAGVFLFAAYSKLKQSYLVFAMSIDSYQLLPEWAVLAVARSLPIIELLIGIGLLIGWKLRQVAFGGMVLLLFFFGILVFSYGKGMAIDCGCFGVGEALSAKTLLRDGALLGAAIALWLLSAKSSQGEARLHQSMPSSAARPANFTD
jgi:uncharacterized membrane protein YphA (DoxX/SURF4 family)